MSYRSVNPGTLLCPVPAVLVSCADRTGRANALAVAWTGGRASCAPIRPSAPSPSGRSASPTA